MIAGNNIRTTLLLVMIGTAGSILTFLIAPIPFRKEVVELRQSFRFAGQTGYLYDLDQNGDPELCRTKTNIIGEAAVVVESVNAGMINQWNLGGRFMDKRNCSAFDLDGDSIAELFLLTLSNDTLYLHVIQPFRDSKHSHFSRMVHVFRQTPPIDDVTAVSTIAADLNRDGKNEALFHINVGFTNTTRRVYAYDYSADSLWWSMELGNKCAVMQVADLQNDGEMELFLRSIATANIDSSHAFHDQETYLFVLRTNLEPLFTPPSFPLEYGYATTFPYVTEQFEGVGAIVFDRTTQAFQLLLYDRHGNLIENHNLDEVGPDIRPGLPRVVRGPRQTTLLFQNVSLQLSGVPLNLEIMHDQPQDHKRFQILHGIDGYAGFSFSQSLNEESIIVLDHETGRNVQFITEEKPQHIVSDGLIHKQENHAEFFFQFKDVLYHYSWIRNPLYPWYYLYYPLIALFWATLILAIYFISRRRLESQFRMKQRMHELEILIMKNQISPHFTFNALNSIGSLIYREKKEHAYQYLGKFSKLIRDSLDSFSRTSIPLEQEITFTRNYLELEKLRFKDKFDFEILMDEGIEQNQLVPKMMLQIHVENALKHGIIPSGHKGLIRVDISKQKENLSVSIKDNGIGREAAGKRKSSGSGNGLRIIRHIFEHFEKTHKVHIEYKIKDLNDTKNRPSGTEVNISIEHQ